MNQRERFLATLNGQPTDQLPYIPRLDLWYRANKRAGTLPEKYKSATLVELLDDNNLGYHHVIPDFKDFSDPLDEVDRALGIYRLRTLPFRINLHNIERDISYQGEMTEVTYKTPYGNLTTKVIYDESMKKAGITITHIAEHAIKSIKDYEAVAYLFDNAEIVPEYDHFQIAREEVGERGVTVAYVSLAGSPMHLIMRELMSYDLFFYEILDHPEELHRLCDRISAYFHRVFDVVAKSPAEVVLLGANYDNKITWPRFFEEHITPSLAEAADILHAQGTYLLTHTDGENRGLLESYVNSKIDIADSVCPAPMTSLTLAETREVLRDKVTIWGGLPSISVLENSMDEKTFDGYLEDQLIQAGKGDHLVLAIADTTPANAKFSRILKIAEKAREFGPVIP